MLKYGTLSCCKALICYWNYYTNIICVLFQYMYPWGGYLKWRTIFSRHHSHLLSDYHPRVNCPSSTHVLWIHRGGSLTHDLSWHTVLSGKVFKVTLTLTNILSKIKNKTLSISSIMSDIILQKHGINLSEKEKLFCFQWQLTYLIWHVYQSPALPVSCLRGCDTTMWPELVPFSSANVDITYLI